MDINKLDIFINKSNYIHNNFYDYSKVKIDNSFTKNVVIICPIHGEFIQLAKRHMNGAKCKKCSIKERSSKNRIGNKLIEQFINNDKFEYYIEKNKNYRADEKIKIKCKKHNHIFEQRIRLHNISKFPCEYCYLEHTKEINTFKQKDVINNFIKKYGNKFDYSKVVYKNAVTPITIICPKHGEFIMKPIDHLTKKFGCNQCALESRTKIRTLNKHKLLEKFKRVHEDKYEYDLSNYKNSNSIIKIICKKCGHTFKQCVNNHGSGNGCPKCKFSKGELRVEKYLIEKNIITIIMLLTIIFNTNIIIW